MCESGINASQMRFSIDQANETVALAQEWIEQLHHQADQGRRTKASVELAQVSVMLGEAREKLEAASESIDAAPSDVTVERV